MRLMLMLFVENECLNPHIFFYFEFFIVVNGFKTIYCLSI